MDCPRLAGYENTTGEEVPFNNFYQIEELRDLAYSIVDKYSGKCQCPKYKLIMHWVAEHMRYMTDMKQFGVIDFWLFPDEVLLTGAEDCDGLSFLVASLLEGVGYSTRVVLGPTPWGYHAWVEFADEANDWFVAESTTGVVYNYEDAIRKGYTPEI